MAVTQFEASDARRCFPCWDEPAAKATFTVSLTVPLEKTALSNMDVVKTTTLPSGTLFNIPFIIFFWFTGEKRVEFDKTPVMSTYLLALAVGDFDFIQSTTKTGVKVRIYTPPGLAPQGQFALDMGGDLKKQTNRTLVFITFLQFGHWTSSMISSKFLTHCQRVTSLLFQTFLLVPWSIFLK